MTFVYDAPGVSEKDTIRFLLQDTDSTEPLLQDEEIQYYITRLRDTWSLEYIASVLADTLAARYAREASYSADGVSVNLAQQAQQFRDLAANLRSQHKNLLVGGLPDVGGITPGEELLPNTRPFSFGTGMHDSIEAGEQDYGGLGASYYDWLREPGV